MENNSSMMKLIVGFVALIVGLGLMATVASSSNAMTSNVAYTDSLDISSARLVLGTIDPTVRFYMNNTLSQVIGSADWGRRDYTSCLISTVTVYNQTGGAVSGVSITAETATTQGYFTLPNSIDINTTAGASNSTSVKYWTCSDDYMTSSFGNTMIKLVPGFFALALLIVAIALFYGVARDEGILTD